MKIFTAATVFVVMVFIEGTMVGQNLAGNDSSLKYKNRIDLALNLGTLYSGTPEFQGDYFLGKTFGFSLAGGYTYKPVRGAIKVDDHVDLIELHGGFYKIGLKARFPIERSYFWINALYIGSWYNEYGNVGLINVSQGTFYDTLIRNVGFVNGAALAIGLDMKVYKKFFIRSGYQVGYYKRDNYLGAPFKTMQPGFGTANQQVVIGICFLTGMKH